MHNGRIRGFDPLNGGSSPSLETKHKKDLNYRKYTYNVFIMNWEEFVERNIFMNLPIRRDIFLSRRTGINQEVRM